MRADIGSYRCCGRRFAANVLFVEQGWSECFNKPTDQAPFVAVRNCLSKLLSSYETKKSIIMELPLQSPEELLLRYV
jgi:hypothetical protein